MKRNVWSVEELARVLVGAQMSNASLPSASDPADRAVQEAWKQGFSAALQAIAIATGVSPSLPR